MKKMIYTTMLTLSLFACTTKPAQSTQTTKNKHSSEVILNNFTGSYYKGNYVWGLAMNLAWQELSSSILHEALVLNTDQPHALEMVQCFNKTLLSKDDIDEASYYVKAGYGQKTVEIINTESRQKFPGKRFADLKITLNQSDIISYAYFLKEVEYQHAFEKSPVDFLGVRVQGFFANTQKQKDSVSVLSYENRDRFIIALKLKNQGDQLFLAKGYDMKNPQALLQMIATLPTQKGLKKQDYFRAPFLHLNCHRDYLDLQGKFLANKNFTSYFIGQMFENIKFDMDEKGARVENEAVITLLKSAGPQPTREEPRYFILDKAYWLIMKRSNSKNPYFMLGINNSKLMKE